MYAHVKVYVYINVSKKEKRQTHQGVCVYKCPKRKKDKRTKVKVYVYINGRKKEKRTNATSPLLINTLVPTFV